MKQNPNIGIDVSKNKFDLAIHETGIFKQFTMSPSDIKKSVRWIKKQKPQLIVLEATGGYQYALVAELADKKLPVAVINPLNIRNFAKSLGKLAKTDKLDAKIIAQYAAMIQPNVTHVLKEQNRRLKALIVRRRQLVDIRATEKNHKEHVIDPEILKSIKQVIENLTQEIENIEKQITDLIHSDPDMKEKLDRLKTIPGIGDTTAALLMANLPELGQFNRRQVASMVGVAPINRDSGQLRGKRVTGKGRRDVRKGLYMAMLSIIQCNSKLKQFYQHLVNSGKAKMVALIATMRKLLIIMNSMLKNNQNWIEKTI